MWYSVVLHYEIHTAVGLSEMFQYAAYTTVWYSLVFHYKGDTAVCWNVVLQNRVLEHSGGGKIVCQQHVPALGQLVTYVVSKHKEPACTQLHCAK